MYEEYRIGEITMSDRTEYIDKQATIGAIHSAIYSYFCGAEDGDALSEDEKLVLSVNKAICTAIKAFPSADVQPVVRCKDCKYQDKGENESESWNVCNYRPWLYFNINDDDYCSNGERKDG